MITDMLLHTLAWTGVLIVLVLLARRPVTRHFGPQVAYALWLIPLARLILPPVVLPAAMAPRAAVTAPQALVAVPEAPAPTLPEPLAFEAAVPAPLAPDPAPAAGFDLLAALADAPLLEALLLVWLAGAGVTLWRRFAAYFALRRALLAEGRELGRAPGMLGGWLGQVRLVETPATNAPLAMGVLDPVIALPPGFLALHDRASRDLALAHELAHHRAGDLLINILVQPLFALHWWNPLGRYGWLALRRDQEAACDARVMAQRPAAERAAYAALIARFAAAPGATHTAALTAPMACPVLGETSIIHRLRSLAMPDLTPRRRLAGRALLGAGLLALPLTASITYAAGDAVAPVAEPPAPPAPPAAPEAPQAPEAPSAPDAPEAPEPPVPPVVVLIERDGVKVAEGADVTERVWKDADGKTHRVRMVFRAAPDGEALARGIEGEDRAAAAARRAEMLAAMQAALAEADQARADMPRIIAEAMAEANAWRDGEGRQRVIVKHECEPGGQEVTETTTRDGTQIVSICQKRMFVSARSGLEEARAEIARDKDIPEDTRKELLKALDRQIARWKEQEG
jgi:beta-lactamase regulating signal transducer with metallopeptidase domain